jgi:hypothetical protein
LTFTSPSIDGLKTLITGLSILNFPTDTTDLINGIVDIYS